MGLMSKICVLFLAWLIFGIIGYGGMALYYATKVYMLDVGSGSVVKEYMDCVLENAADGCGKETLRALKGTIFDSKFVTWFLIGLLWPMVVSQAQPVYRAVYESFKDEYDRGIRIRKEPS